MYEYFYYKLYKSLNTELFNKWTELRTASILIMLEIVFICSLVLYYEVFIDRYLRLPENLIPWAVGLALILSILQYYTFESKDQWKDIIKKYDAWPKKKNSRGTLIVWTIIILIFSNIIIAFYFFSRVDWSLYQ